MRAGRAWRAIADACLDQIRANEAGAIAGRDAESLHQFRVGWTRLRVALSMPRDRAWRGSLARLRPELRWLSHTLGDARDWDVFTQTLLPRSRSTDAFRARCARASRDRHEAVRGAIRSPRYGRLLRGVEALAGEIEVLAPDTARGKARRFAEAVLERRRRKLRRRRERPLSDTPARERHRIRIAAKKLRYAVELLAPLYREKKARRYARRVERLQDALGDLNDLANGMRMSRQASAGAPGAARRVQASLRGSERERLPDLDRVWSRFARKKPFWR